MSALKKSFTITFGVIAIGVALVSVPALQVWRDSNGSHNRALLVLAT